MSSKRAAGTELNHDNWNEDEESEDAGEFKKASEDILQKRVKKVAKRRIAGDSDGQASNPFSGFGGFNKSSLSTSTPSPFSFLSKLPAATPQINKTNGDAKFTNSIFSSTKNNSNNSEYYSKVKSLNTAFIDWIKSSVEENKGLCDLTPIFKDYEKYMKECQELKDNHKKEPAKDGEEKKETPANNFTFEKPATSPGAGIFSTFSKTDTMPKDSSPQTKQATAESNSKPFSFGMASTNSLANLSSTTPSFSFGLQKTSTGINATAAAAPIFGNLTNVSSSTPFTFSNVTQTNTVKSSENTNDEDAEEEPPKNVFVPVVEEDSLYSKRCKVFVKSGSDYADRGIGTLYLKKVEEKVQLIVRADTNLGNILMNIIISEGLPTSRLGKNNVMIVCLPTPESKPPPIPVLIRVKTSEEADELLATIEKHKA